MNAETLTREDTLGLLNQHRAEWDLPPLAADDMTTAALEAELERVESIAEYGNCPFPEADVPEADGA